MGIYDSSRPGMKFLDSFIDAAKYRDSVANARNASIMGGLQNLVKGGADAFKFTRRQAAMDDLESMQAELEKLQAERDRLASGSPDLASGSPNMSAILLNPHLNFRG